MRGVWGQVLTRLWLPVLWAGSKDGVTTGCRCGHAGVVTRHWPLCLHALLVIARGGAGTRLPWGDYPLALLRCVYHLALPLRRLPVPWACSRGPIPVFIRRGGCGCGSQLPTPRRKPLPAGVVRCGDSRGRSLGGGDASPYPGCPSFEQAVGFRCRRSLGSACGCGGAALALWLSCPSGHGALQKWQGDARGGGAPLAELRGVCNWALALQRLPIPWACSRVPCPCLLIAVGAGLGACLRPYRAGCCKLAWRRAGVAGARPREGTCCLFEGCPGVGILPRPTFRPLGSQSGSAARGLWVRFVGVGAEHGPCAARPIADVAVSGGGGRAF